MTRPEDTTITAVPGIRVGHAAVPEGGSGCTVVVGPFRGAVEIRGMATGSRELGALDLTHLVERVDALLLTGGSAFGLAAADGVMETLAEAGRGFDTGIARVPIVPTGVIFDLTPDGARPGSVEGRTASAAALGPDGEGPVREGAVGAGAGARVGKLAGTAAAMAGGLGSAVRRVGPWSVGALVVVNAAGDVLDAGGRIVAGARRSDGQFLSSDEVALGGFGSAVTEGDRDGVVPGTNTTLAVVATDAPLTRVDLARLAKLVSTALARRIVPVHTPFDGDLIFALSTAEEAVPHGPLDLTALGIAGRQALETAIENAIRQPG